MIYKVQPIPDDSHHTGNRDVVLDIQDSIAEIVHVPEHDDVFVVGELVLDKFPNDRCLGLALHASIPAVRECLQKRV